MTNDGPHQGDRLVVIKAFPALGVTQWRAPFTGGFECVVPAGSLLVVLSAHTAAEGFACKPEDYERLETLLVPQEDRTSENYDGYYLVLNKSDVGEKLQRVPA